MAWENRQRGGRYYTRTRRVRGRCVREYVGGGTVGELAAKLDAMDREHRAARRRWLGAESETLAALDSLFGHLSWICDDLHGRKLSEAGCHCHRGEWRRKRHVGKKEEKDLAQAEIWAAATGDVEALTKLKSLTAEMPELIREAYDLDKQTERHLINLVAGPDLLMAEGARLQAREMFEELCGSKPTPIERTICQRIVSCWLHTHYLEHALCGALRTNAENRVSLYQKWLDLAEKRFLRALKTLAQTRRLLGPAIQVNIAERQVNVS
jgi:hypothetical protein